MHNAHVAPFSYLPFDDTTNDMYSLRNHESIDKDILIVEDEQDLSNLLLDVLETEGHTARTAGNGLEALSRIEERRPQLILLDMMMPVMDGWQFIERLRANEEWTNIPVVVMTAVYDMSSLERKTGAKAILTKPFDIELIVDAVDLYAD
jgi:two-component system, chemotaxis family, chemotaxis protein CheY